MKEKLDTLETLEDLESENVKVNENMEPPKLELKDEGTNIMETGDLASSNANANIYAEEEIEEKIEEMVIEDIKEPEKVNFAIPAAVVPEKNINESQTDIDSSLNEINNNEEPSKVIKFGNKKIKINLNKNKPVPLLICIVAVIIFFVIGLLVGKALFKTTVYSGARPSTISKTKLVADGKNNVTKAGDYTYKIPKDYLYDKSEQGLLVYDKNAAWRIFIRADSGLYDDLSNAKNSIKATLIDASVTVNQLKETKINENNVLVVEGTTKTTNRLIAFADAKNDHIYYMEIITSDNKYNYDLLSIATDIAINATYDREANEIEQTGIYDISELVVTAASAYKALNK